MHPPRFGALSSPQPPTCPVETPVPPLLERPIHELFLEHAKRTPAAIALVDGDRTLNYGELDTISARLASRLAAAGVGPGDFVAVELGRSLELIVAFLATLRAGAAYWPLEEHLPAARRALLLADAKPRLLLCSESNLGGSAAAPCRALAIEPLLRPDATASTHSWIDATTRGDTPAYLNYTSGSTGRPKGVVVPHRGVVRLVRETDYIAVHPDDVFAHVANPAFDAVTFELWGALLNGARVIVIAGPDALDPHVLGKNLRRHGVTTLFLTTALFNQVALQNPTAFTALRHLLFGGEACNPECVRRALVQGAPGRLLHVYGPTEVTTFATWHLVTEVPETAATLPIGRRLANTSVHVLDERNRPLPAGQPGEIHLGGPGVALGYLHQHELTAERFPADPFSETPGTRLYRTGDRGVWREDGALEILGRLDDQVKLRGFRIELGEIETALRSLPGVIEAIALVRETAPGDRRLLAYYTADAKSPEPATLRTRLAEKLPAYAIPSSLVRLNAFPLTANGKVDRRALPDPAPAAASTSPPPRSALEHTLAGIWREVLGLPTIGVDDNFFDLGGHSLLAVGIATRIERELGKRVPISVLFRAPTVAGLATWIGDADPSAAQRSLVTLRAEGHLPPLFCVHGWGGDAFAFVELARALPPGRPVRSLQARGLDGRAPHHESVETMAADYAREILAAQPDGPHHLIGYSAGGWIAYAVAVEILRQGGRVGALVLLDTTSDARIPPAAHTREKLHERIDRLGFHLRHLNVYRERLGALAPAALIRHVVGRLFIRSRHFSRPARIAAAPGVVIQPEKLGPDVWDSDLPTDYFHALVSRYHPPRFPGDLTLFTSTDTKPYQLRFWKTLARGRITLHPTRFKHLEIIDRERVPHFVSALASELAARDVIQRETQ